MAVRAGVSAGVAGMAAVAAIQKVQKKESVKAFGGSDYPPHGLSKSVQELPQWIQKGCGNKSVEYQKSGIFLNQTFQ